MGATSKMVQGEFFNAFVYSVCRAMSEHCGTERAEKILNRFGELLFDEIMERRQLTLTDPLETLQSIAEYLVSSGYMAKIDINEIEKLVYTIEMFGGPAHDSSQRLIAGGYAPSHVLTNTMFAALARMGLQAELEHLDVSDSENTVERWQLMEVGG
jgi:hypothetical protein